MTMADAFLWDVAFELALFAAVMFALFSVDDLAMDILAFLRPRHAPRALATGGTQSAHRFAVFIPAWREGNVIGPMLDHLCASWPGATVRVYVGVYPNDAATIFAAADAAQNDARVRLVINEAVGPTTKGACLNRMWRALQDDVAQRRFAPTAVLFHDAEDCVDPLAIDVLAHALDQADFAQLQVIPVHARGGLFIGGHYCDEFAEAHVRDMPVRSALGAPMPTAGVGCAFRIEALQRLDTGGGPFADGSLTEDYELGMRLCAMGFVGRFVGMTDRDGRWIGTRAIFPRTLAPAVRQKARWLRGIALDGWDNLGWVGCGPDRPWSTRLIAIWMQWRDRRSLLGAMTAFTGYAAVLMVLVLSMSEAGRAVLLSREVGASVRALLIFNGLMLIWRVMMRCIYTGQVYGLKAALLAPLRQPLANVIHIMTAWRAVRAHWAGKRGAPLEWDKTTHEFPAQLVQQTQRQGT